MRLKWRRPRLLIVQVALIFAVLAISAVLVTTAVATVTIIAEENQILTSQEAALSRAAAHGAAVAYQSAPTHTGWRRELVPAIAVADQSGVALQVRDLAGRVVRSSPGFAGAPPPAKAAPVLVDGRLVGWVVLKFGRSGIGRIVGHFQSQRWHFRLIAAGAGILLAMLLAAVLIPLVVGPVDKLIGAARARSEGRLRARVGPVRGLRDMRELAAAYDHMADVVDVQDQMRRNLVAYMAHELRTPIAVVQASTEAMLDQVVEVTAEQLESLHAEAVKLTGLVDRLQRMTVTAAAFAEFELRTEDLAAIASEAADNLESVFRGVRVRLIRRLDSAPARFDHGRMREVVTNLLSNAAKFTPAGGQVVLETRAGKDAAMLQVSDTGPGIPPEDLPLVAKRFYRSPRTSGVTGSGLGLAIADELVRAHGGTMTITSQLGKGTTVTIEVPYADNGSPAGPLHVIGARHDNRRRDLGFHSGHSEEDLGMVKRDEGQGEYLGNLRHAHPSALQTRHLGLALRPRAPTKAPTPASLPPFA